MLYLHFLLRLFDRSIFVTALAINRAKAFLISGVGFWSGYIQYKIEVKLQLVNQHFQCSQPKVRCHQLVSGGLGSFVRLYKTFHQFQVIMFHFHAILADSAQNILDYPQALQISACIVESIIRHVRAHHTLNTHISQRDT